MDFDGPIAEANARERARHGLGVFRVPGLLESEQGGEGPEAVVAAGC